MPYKDKEKQKEASRIYSKKRYDLNPERERLRNKIKREKNRDYYTNYCKSWYENNKKEHYSNVKQRKKERKIMAITKLGGKCVNCGCDDVNALEFNHINGCGRQERKKRKNYTENIVNDILNNNRNDIDLRCRPCNALHYLIELKGLKNKWKIIYENY